MGETVTVYGIFGHVACRNQESGIARFFIIPAHTVPGIRGGELECVGRINVYYPGLPIEVTGDISDDGVFHVTSDRMPPYTERGTYAILDYAAKGLTEAQKKAVANVCKNDIASFCKDDRNLEILENLVGPSRDARQAVRQLFCKIRDIFSEYELTGLLMTYGIPFDRIMRMSRKGVTIDALRKDAYLEFAKCDISIRQADCFARREFGVQEYDLPRVRGLVLAALRRQLESGSTCCTLGEVERDICSGYGDMQDSAYFGKALINACVMSMPSICKYHEVEGKQYIYLNHVWEEETAVIQNAIRLQTAGKEYNCREGPESAEEASGIRYNKGQREAFRLLQKGGIKILTGPPGSGKTAVINGLIHNFEANGNGKVHLAATTGMAAKVMRSATGRDSETVHKMLRIFPFQDTVCSRGINDPVDADFVIVDEMSMMGLKLFSALLQAVRSGAILLLVGDEDQLQSVEYGNVLHDMLSTGLVETCRLTEVLRQSGTICINASRIKAGIRSMETDGTFRIKETAPGNTPPMVFEDYDPFVSQVICPIKEGDTSTNSLNTLIQEKYNGSNKTVAVYGKRVFRMRDKVIMTRTDYGKGYVNGDIGIITDQTPSGGIEVAFRSGIIELSREDLCNMELAYAVTIHKAQGSEFEKVHVVLPSRAANMMTRRLLYTAVTRAKKEVIIYSEGTSFPDAVDNAAEHGRFTLLGRRLTTCMGDKA